MGRIRGLHACEARAKVELDRIRRSDRTSGPPRRPLDDEFEGTAPPEGRGRRARDDDRGGNNDGRRSRRVVGGTRVRFSQAVSYTHLTLPTILRV